MKYSFQSVLMVDDDDATNFLHKRIIKKLNPSAEIKVFNESLNAMDYLKKSDYFGPDLMFLDLNMPAIHGWEVLENLSSKNRSNLSIIVLSSYICIETKKKFVSSAYKIAFVEKPLNLDKLSKALTQIQIQSAIPSSS